MADSVQNHRLIPFLSKYYDVHILQRKLNDENHSESIWSPNLSIIDRLLYKVFPSLFGIFSLDRYVWSKIAYYKIRMKLPDFSHVIMIYEPYTTRPLQFSIRRHFKNIKITSVLYDPYVDNIFFGKSGMAVKLRKNIERNIMDASDLVVVNNAVVFSKLKSRYPDVQLCLVPLCGLADNIGNQSDSSGTLTLVHAGNIYGERRLDELNETITLLKKLKDIKPTDLKIILIGSHCVGYEKVIAVGNDDIIKFQGPMYGDSFKSLMATSNALLLIDPMDGNNTCFPSKLCEYYQLSKPIFAFCAKGTPSYISLSEAGHVACGSDELMKMVLALGDFVQNPESLNNTFDISYAEQFHPSKVAGQFNKALSCLV